MIIPLSQTYHDNYLQSLLVYSIYIVYIYISFLKLKKEAIERLNNSK
jgi:hypothetical protein